MLALRLVVALLSTLVLADCGGMHACTADGVPCADVSARPRSTAPGSGGARPSTPMVVVSPTTLAASAPFVPPAFDPPAPPVSPEVDTPPAAPIATVTETSIAEEPEESGRHPRRHGRHGGRHRSGGSRHRRHH